MSIARDFLDDFKTHRGFKKVLPKLKADAELRNAVFGEIEKDEYPYSDHASWIAIHFFEHTRADFSEWRDQFIEIIKTTKNHSIQRNLTHIFAYVKPQVSENGDLLDKLFFFVQSSDSLPALKVNAFKAIEKQYLKKYPELLMELKHLIDLHENDDRPSIQALRRNFLKKYHKQLQQFA